MGCQMPCRSLALAWRGSVAAGPHAAGAGRAVTRPTLIRQGGLKQTPWDRSQVGSASHCR